LDLPGADARSIVEEGLHNLQLLTDTVLSTDIAAEIGKIYLGLSTIIHLHDHGYWTDEDRD
jgi:hypothetical protein